MRCLFLIAFVFIVGCAAPTSHQTANTASPLLESTSTPQPEAPQLCAGEVDGGEVGYTLSEPGTSAELIWSPTFAPYWVRSSPDGRLLAVSDVGDSIYELKSDGSLVIVFRCSGKLIETFAAATDGSLWFTTEEGELYKVDPDASVNLMGVSNPNLEPGLDGSVYALGNGLYRIDPNGEQQLISNEVGGRKFAIGPNGEIVVKLPEIIVEVSASGEITELASGYGPEPWPTFGPDGKLYVTHWTGIDVIDLETGSITPIDWLENSNVGESGAFASDGRLLLYHPNTSIFAADLEAQAISVLHQVQGNTTAMAINSGDGVYLAFGNNQPAGETEIYRVLDSDNLELVSTVPYGIARSMDFDSQGIGYIAVADDELGSAIIRFNPVDGSFEEYYRPECWPFSLTVHPQTDLPWWEDCGQHFFSLNESGNRITVPAPSNGQNIRLAITSAGEFYSIAFYNRTDSSIPYEHRLFRWDESSQTWQEIADLTQSDPGITIATLAACPDGHIYTVESLDASNLPVDYSSYNAVRRLEEDGTLTLIGFDFSFDGGTADCDAATNTIYFPSGVGVFAVTPR